MARRDFTEEGQPSWQINSTTTYPQAMFMQVSWHLNFYSTARNQFQNELSLKSTEYNYRATVLIHLLLFEAKY
jgi:hypothetical protein